MQTERKVTVLLRIALIASGGAVGALLRYGVGGLVQRLGSGAFPIGTLAVNLTGCFLIGVLAATFAGPYMIRAEVRTFLMVGLLGAFTTFSTYGLETFGLINERQLSLAVLNVGLSNIVGLAAVWLGYRLSEAWFGA